MTQLRGAEKLQHSHLLGSFRNWMHLLLDNRDVDRYYMSRVVSVSLTTLLTSPLRAYEWARYRHALETTRIEEPPIFILGHWRSGTTHLHYLMCQDPGLGYISTFHTLAPEILFVGDGTLRPAFGKMSPNVRLMDNMAFSIDTPQEDELAMANSSLHSFYHQWTFPRRARYYLERYALFEGTPERDVEAWKRAYERILRKATLKAGGRRLVLKNPVNTGRVARVLEMFPDAKFIHIYRNPYRVFLSTAHFYRKTLPANQLQDIDWADVEANILHNYERIMQAYLAQARLIPAGNLIEVRFEDLERDPLGELRRVYEHLALPGFSTAEPAFRTYLTMLDGYQKNDLPMTPEDIDKVNRNWGFAFDAWGYPRLDASNPPIAAS